LVPLLNWNCVYAAAGRARAAITPSTTAASNQARVEGAIRRPVIDRLQP
jgi:hypothetical protein